MSHTEDSTSYKNQNEETVRSHGNDQEETSHRQQGQEEKTVISFNSNKEDEATEIPQNREEVPDTIYNHGKADEATTVQRQRQEEHLEYENPIKEEQTASPQVGDFILNKGPETDAKLVYGWSIKGRKKFILREGKNYIGRRDEALPSDLSLNDDYASARSICIEATKTYSQRGMKNYEYQLTIERAKNPVLICNREYPIGSCIMLDYNDTIVLGKTKLTLKSI
ncbi:MAG: hypothetical protein J5548_14215 [Prevotella sp.]|nr:hypothetical protein [Prevotella sp.]